MFCWFLKSEKVLWSELWKAVVYDIKLQSLQMHLLQLPSREPELFNVDRKLYSVISYYEDKQKHHDWIFYMIMPIDVANQILQQNTIWKDFF